MGWRIHLMGGHVDRHHAVPVREQQPVKGSGVPRHGRTQTMETIQAPPVEAEDHQRPHHPKQTKTDAVRSLRTDPCGGTSTQRRKGNGLAVGRIRLWAGRQPPRHPKENSTSKKQSRLIPAERTEMIGMTRPKAKDRPRGKPFDEPERKYLCGLDIIDACTEKKNHLEQNLHRIRRKGTQAGSRPVDISVGGVGPELIGRKRIERAWRDGGPRSKKGAQQ